MNDKKEQINERNVVKHKGEHYRLVETPPSRTDCYFCDLMEECEDDKLKSHINGLEGCPLGHHYKRIDPLYRDLLKVKEMANE